MIVDNVTNCTGRVVRTLRGTTSIQGISCSVNIPAFYHINNYTYTLTISGDSTGYGQKSSGSTCYLDVRSASGGTFTTVMARNLTMTATQQTFSSTITLPSSINNFNLELRYRVNSVAEITIAITSIIVKQTSPNKTVTSPNKILTTDVTSLQTGFNSPGNVAITIPPINGIVISGTNLAKNQIATAAAWNAGIATITTSGTFTG